MYNTETKKKKQTNKQLLVKMVVFGSPEYHVLLDQN